MKFNKFCVLIITIAIALCSISISVYAWHTIEEGPYTKGQNPTTIYRVEKDLHNGFDKIVEKEVFLKKSEFKRTNSQTIKNENGYIETWYNEKPVYMYMENENLKYGCTRACFMPNEIKDAMKKGWLTGELFSLQLYNPDGTSKRVYGDDLETAFNDGWYTYPVKYLYKPDGTKEVFKEEEVAQKLEIGWYEYPVCVVYANDGRESIIKQEELESYLDIGYYESLEGMKILYAPDGSQKLVDIEDVDSQIALGWYEEPVCMIYNEYGQSSLVYEHELEMYRLAGWFEENDKKILYAPDGRSEEVIGKDVFSQLSVGWYSYPVAMVYSADGRSLVIPKNELDAYKNVGWDDKTTTMFSADGRELEVPLIQVELYKAVNWMTLEEYITFDLDRIVVEEGYAYAVSVVENFIEAIDDEYLLEFCFNERARLLNEWRSVNRCPIAVTGWDIDENSIGTPEVSVELRNLSDKTITAYKVKFTCYDAYGKIATDYSYKDGTVIGSSSRTVLKPNSVWSATFTLYGNEETAKISWPIITQIAFDDGTTWYR